MVLLYLGSWSRCTAIDPPLALDEAERRGLGSACGAHAPYVAHLQPLPGDTTPDECWAWFCPGHAARFRADPKAVERLVQIRTTAPGSAHRPTERSPDHP